jgi:DNA-binding winged helix-turn-helix (wHTH) protein
MDGTLGDSPRRRWQAGSIIFDEATRELRVAGERRAIEEKPLQILIRLLEAQGRVTGHRELLTAAWGNAEVPSLASLQTAMSKLRKALGPGERDLIEVVTGQGYRITKPVERVAAGAWAAEDPDAFLDRVMPMAFDPPPAVRRGLTTTVTRVLAGCVAITILAIAWRAETRAARYEGSLTAIAHLMAEDVIAASGPDKSGQPNIPLIEALLRAEPQFGARLADEPRVAAPIYASLAVALDFRDHYNPARTAYERAESAYRAAEGDNSPGRVIMMLRQSMMEARSFQRGAAKRAEALLADAEPRVPRLHGRMAEAKAWLLAAKGNQDSLGAGLAKALDEYSEASRLAEANPEAFDPASRFLLRYRVGHTEMKLGRYQEANAIFNALVTEETAQRGRMNPQTLQARLGQASTALYANDPTSALREANALLPDMETVFGANDNKALLARNVIAYALFALDRYDEAARAAMDAATRAAGTQGEKSFFATSLRGVAGESKCHAGDYAGGLALQRSAYETFRETLGEANPATASARLSMATCVILAGRPLEAAPLLEKLNCEELAGLLGQPDMCVKMEALDAAVAQAQSRYTEARTKAHHALASMRDDPNSDPFYRDIAEHVEKTVPETTAFDRRLRD